MVRAAGRAVRPVDRYDGDGAISGIRRQESMVYGGERDDAGGDGQWGVVGFAAGGIAKRFHQTITPARESELFGWISYSQLTAHDLLQELCAEIPHGTIPSFGH